MIGLAVFLLGAAAAYGVARRLGVPTTPFLLLAGIVLNVLDLVPRAILQDSLVLGLTFLLFVTGIELSPRRVRAQRRAALRVGLFQFGVLGAAGVGLSLALGLDPLTAAYLGLALTASSTLVVVRLLQRRKQLFEPFGRLVVGVLLLQDVLVILLVPLLTRLPEGPASVAWGVLGTAALVALAFAFQRWATPLLVSLQHEEEVLLLAVLSVLFAFVGLADALALPLAAGAFLAGVTLSPFPVSGMIRGQLAPVAEFFTAIFFIALGALLSAPGPVVLLHALALAALVVLATPPLVVWVAERSGFAARPGIESGLLLSQTSELSLVVGLQGLLLAQITPDVFTTLALVTVATMVLTPFLATEPVVRRLMRLHPLARAGEVAPPSGHVLLLGCGSGGMPLLETLLALGEAVVVVDDDPEVVERLREGEVTCIRGDAADPEALRQAGAGRAKLISSTVRRPRDNRRLLETVEDVPVLVRVFDDDEAAWVAELGGIPVMYSEAAAEEFLRWFDRLPAPAGGGAANRNP
ncbi:MAG TPA: cation:proton antiporter [Longimicrobiaceae bacterium]|nr:cation:proton antiporter [Longimicrobiaceae bacterium]